LEKGYTLVEVLVVVVILVIAGVAVFAYGGVGCSWDKDPIQGTVMTTGSRMKYKHSKRGFGGEHEKYAVALINVTGEIPEGHYSEPMLINCDSTQCATLLPNMRVQFQCYNQWHACGPNELECRFDKVLGMTEPAK